MNDNLKKYQDILINLTLENKTIYLDEIDKNKFFDLYNLKKFNEELYLNLIDFIFSDKDNILKIVDDPLEWQNVKIEDIKNIVNKEKNEKLEEFENNTDFEDRNEYRNFLENFYRNNINKHLDILNEKYSYMSGIISDLEILCKDDKEKYLYVGYPFVEGYVDEKNYVRMPLFLIPIRLFNENNSWYLEKNLNQKIEINKYLLLILKQIFNDKQIDIKEEYSFKSEFKREVIYNVLDFLKNYDITLNFNDGFLNSNIEKFSDILNSFVDGKPYLKVRNFIVLGDFQIINDEFNDYEYLKNVDISESVIFRILDKENNNCLDNVKPSENLYVKDVLDFSQQNAIKFVDNKNVCLVNSPIGTGKNTTIFNFILDKISKNKKVLLVTKNNHFLEKMYSKLSSINSVVMKVTNCEKDFYDNFIREFNAINTFKNDDVFCEYFEKVVEDICNKYSFINEANEVYNNVEKFGLSLQQMYEYTMGIDNDNLDNEAFKKFTNNNPVSGCTFNEIVSSINKIKNEGLINLFIEHKEYLNKYKVVNFIRDDFEIEKRESYISRLEDLKSRKVALDIEKNECSLKIIELFKEGNLTKGEIINEARKFDKSYVNREFVSDESNDSWFKNLSFLKNKKGSKDDISEATSEKVYSNVEGYYRSVSRLVEDISFLEEILKIENFNFIRDKVLNFEDITEFITTLLEMLESFHKFLASTYKIQNFDRVLSDILEYIYNNSVNEQMMNDNLEEILKFSVLINIMRRHHKCGDELMKYKFVDESFENLRQLFEKRKDGIDKFVLNKVKSHAFNYICNGNKENFVRDVISNVENYSIKRFMREVFDICLELFPCFLIEHSLVSSTLPMIEGMFDYIIIDDGHGYYISDVIPHMYRAKQVVVFGDEKQINSQNKIYNIISSQSDYVCDNLFKFIKDRYEFLELRYLYSEGSEILSELSNVFFNNLDIIKAPNLVKFSEIKTPFDIFKINSQVVDGINENEAEFVVSLLYDILKNKNIEQSIGIVTLTKDYADLISKILEDRIKLDQTFNYLYYKECKKYSDKTYDGIYVKSIGEINYDRRDIIIFALGGGFNIEGAFELKFDEIEDNTGLNKLNIFMNLATHEMKIVSSFNVEELNLKEYDNENIKLLKRYLSYAKSISIGKVDEVMSNLNESTCAKDKCEDVINKIQHKLAEKGLVVDRNFGNLSYKFDLAIYDNDFKQYILFVDFDGKLIKKFKDPTERNIDSVIYFEKFGCNILKIWSKDLWTDIDSQINYIVDVYRNIKENLLINNSSVSDFKSNRLKILSKFVNILDGRYRELISKIDVK